MKATKAKKKADYGCFYPILLKEDGVTVHLRIRNSDTRGAVRKLGGKEVLREIASTMNVVARNDPQAIFVASSNNHDNVVAGLFETISKDGKRLTLGLYAVPVGEAKFAMAESMTTEAREWFRHDERAKTATIRAVTAFWTSCSRPDQDLRPGATLRVEQLPDGRHLGITFLGMDEFAHEFLISALVENDVVPLESPLKEAA